MQIIPRPVNPRQDVTRTQTKTAEPQAETKLRPSNDWWEAGDIRFESTSDLLSAELPEGTKLSYNFVPEEVRLRDFETSRNASQGALLGTLASAAAIAGVALAGGVGVIPAALGVVLGAAGGALIGGIRGHLKSAKNALKKAKSASGYLSYDKGAPTFKPAESSESVNLKEFAKASKLSPVDPTADKFAWYSVGAVSAMVASLPVVGTVLSSIGLGGLWCKATDDGSGAVLGALASVAATVGPIVALNMGGDNAYIKGIGGAMLLTGLITGPIVNRASMKRNGEFPDMEKQWWHQAAGPGDNLASAQAKPNGVDGET